MTETLASVVRGSEGAHWYDENLNPVYEILGKNGKYRPVKITDARQMKLKPGVSIINKMQAEPGLENWKQTQIVLAALTLPRLLNESDDDFAKRVITDSREQGNKAAQEGTNIHKAIEQCLRGEPYDPVYQKHVTATVDYINSLVSISEGSWQTERIVVSRLGYGGKTDLVNEKHKILVDFKGSEFEIKENGKPSRDLVYDNHRKQLAAYQVAITGNYSHDDWHRINMFISRSVPGVIYPYVHDAAEWDRDWGMFHDLLSLWKKERRYDPAW
jgi:hypothetical protein